MEKRLVKIGEAAKLLGTTPDTLRKWEASGELLPARKTKGEKKRCWRTRLN
jgi:DNA-binding transcriptional MerR regulator